MTLNNIPSDNKTDEFDEIKRKCRIWIKKKSGSKLNVYEQSQIGQTIDEFFKSPEFRETLKKIIQKQFHPEKKTKTGLISQLATLSMPSVSSDKTDIKKGFHTRFQESEDGKTITEKDENGFSRIFRKNKEGQWTTEGPYGTILLENIGRNLFNVREPMGNGAFETTLYAPARKVSEKFVGDGKGGSRRVDYTEEDLNGWRIHRVFNEQGKVVQETEGQGYAIEKLVRDGTVLFDKTKPSNNKLININKGLTR